MIYSLKDKILFGMHKGMPIKELIETNLAYVEWALDEVIDFQLDDKAMEFYEEIADKHYDV